MQIRPAGYIRSGNGPPFGNVLNMRGFTKLAVRRISLGIKTDCGAPDRPERNGSHERIHKGMKKELQNKVYGDLKQHQKMFEKWRNEFNEVRPHEALGMKTPKECYTKSERKYFGPDVEIDYHGKTKSRMVNDRGVQLENKKDICRQSIFRILCRRKRTLRQMDRSMVW